PWPDPVLVEEDTRHRPARKAGSLAVLHDGRVLLYLERGGRKVIAFDDDPARLAKGAEALVRIARTGRLPRLTIETVGGAPVGPTVVGEALQTAGFVRHPKGLRVDARG
ncbi:hypothetical protein, partial [Acinetobacter baumannii]|uniref:hypothetical protein n=1 Tax=Acinetobacter baumannii TaxID=470 RepID=UPI0018999160